jgi:membrane protein implicated in regulation of membrane protease activity
VTWANFYLICFVVGFTFSLISFLSGGTRWHVHLPHGPGHLPLAGHLPIAGHGGGPVTAGHGLGMHTSPAGGVATAGGIATAPGQAVTDISISPFNFVTLTAFLAWFGGTGYLLTRYASVWFVVGLGIALVSGVLGGGIVFWFLSKVLTSEEENLDPADFEMVGVLGRMSISIRAGGTGEIIYSQAGTRRTCGARSENGAAIAKGEEVVVTRYEKGIAYVRPWKEMSGEETLPAEPVP